MENQSFTQQPIVTNPRNSHVVVFTSGKGGVGKTCITTNVATAMAHRGARVCIFDADTGLANINILLKLQPEYSLEHLLSGEKSIQEILIKTSQGVGVVPGASGVADIANLNGDQINRLCTTLTELEAGYDYFLIDTAAGVADSVLQFIESAPYAFILITPEPTSLTDAFSLLKLLNARKYPGRLRVIVNMAEDYANATDTFRRFAAAAAKYLDIKVEYGGFVARDESLPASVLKQIPVVDLIANAPASRCLFALADNLLKYIGSVESNAGLADYWNNILQDHATDKQDTDSQKSMETKPVQIDQTPSVVSKQNFEAIANQLLSALKNQSPNRASCEAFLTDYIETFLTQFGDFPLSFRQLLFRWLESSNYEAHQLQELAGTLEMLYMAKHQKPLHSLENSLARLIAQCQGSETQMQELVTQLRGAYRQSFQVDAFDARQEVLISIRQDSFSEEDFQHLLNALSQAFQDRFKRPYQGQSDLLLETTAETLAEIGFDEKKLQAQIEDINHGFQQLNQRRQALLMAITQGQCSTVNFNSSSTIQD
jgi:flagellar biosynthesis protein FlhG